MIRPSVGDPEDLVLDFINSTKTVGVGQTVVTSGWRAQGLASLFPPGIPVGRGHQGLGPRAGGKPAGPRATIRRPGKPRPRAGAYRGAPQVIVTPKILARLVVIAILVVLLQLSFFSRVTFLETSPDILPAFVVVLGLLGGSMAGAVTGFSVGFLVDCLVAGTLGVTSLVLLGVGYVAGLFRERFEIHSALVPPLLCMGLTLAAEAGFALVELTLGIDAPISDAGPARHGAEEHLRLLPRLAALLRDALRPSRGAGR